MNITVEMGIIEKWGWNQYDIVDGVLCYNHENNLTLTLDEEYNILEIYSFEDGDTHYDGPIPPIEELEHLLSTL